jgi:hypothetical protein
MKMEIQLEYAVSVGHCMILLGIAIAALIVKNILVSVIFVMFAEN